MKKATKGRARTPRATATRKGSTNGKKSPEQNRLEALTFSRELGKQYVRPILEGMDPEDITEQHWIDTSLSTRASWPEFRDAFGTPHVDVELVLGGVSGPTEDVQRPVSRGVTIRLRNERGGIRGDIDLQDYQLPGFIRALAGLLAKGEAERVLPGLDSLKAIETADA